MDQNPSLPPELQAPAAPDVVDGSVPAAAPAPSSRAKALRTAGIVATGVVAGALGVAVLQGGGTSTASTLTAANGQVAGPGSQLGGPPGTQQGTGQQGPLQQGSGQQGSGQQGPLQQGSDQQGTGQQGQFGPPGGFGGPGGGPGGVEGETRVMGTVTAVSSASITVTAADGTVTTAPVSSSTEVVVDGARATISDVKKGDTAVLHVVPDGSGTVAERVLVGMPPGGAGGPGQAPPQGTGSST